MNIVALVVALLVSIGIIFIGARFIYAPRTAMLGYGVEPDDLRAMTEVKGVRDITSGIVVLVVWAAASHTVLGWTLIAVTLTPIADAAIVLSQGGKLATALGVHGFTAAFLLAVGVVLILG